MRKISSNLKGHVTEIINRKKNEMLSLTRKDGKSYKKKNLSHMQRRIQLRIKEDKKYSNIRNHCHYTGKYRRAAYGICNMRSKTPKEIQMVFHNCSNGRRT